MLNHKHACVLYHPENKPPPPFSAVDMAQTGEGAYFQQCAMHLECKPTSSRNP